jgi:colanic acid/amylovoran biosynthesis protein
LKLIGTYISLTKRIGYQWEKSMIKFLISQANSFYNKGEAAIGISIVKTIRGMYPDAEINFLSSDPEAASRILSRYGVRSYERLLNTHKRKYKGSKKILYLTELASKAVSVMISSKINLLNKNEKVVLDLIRDSDILVIGGGGMFGGNKYRSISSNLLPLYVAKKLGKKAMVYSPSVEPFTSRIVRLATRIAFNKADVITVREKYTVDLLRDLKVTTPIYLTADPAFLIDNEPIEIGFSLLAKARVPADGRLRIGVTIRDWHFPGEADAGIKQANYQRAIRDSIENIIKELNAIIVLFTTSINAPYDDDRDISTKIRDSLSEEQKKSVYVLVEDYTPEETKAMIGTMDIFVATRTHSAIFALTMNTPLLHISCEPNKNHGIIESLGLEDYLLDASTISTDSLVQRIRQLVNERTIIAQRIKKEIPIVKAKSMENGKILNALVTGIAYEKPLSFDMKKHEPIPKI